MILYAIYMPNDDDTYNYEVSSGINFIKEEVNWGTPRNK